MAEVVNGPTSAVAVHARHPVSIGPPIGVGEVVNRRGYDVAR